MSELAGQRTIRFLNALAVALLGCTIRASEGLLKASLPLGVKKGDMHMEGNSGARRLGGVSLRGCW